MKKQNGKETFISVRGKGCIGCVDTKSDIMISFGGNGKKIRDVFMSNKEAILLSKKIKKIIKYNQKEKE